MSRRLTLSDTVEVLLGLAEAQRAENARLGQMLGAAIEAMTARPQPSASQTVTLKRTTVGPDKITAPELVGVVQDGETFHEAVERVRTEYERLAARFPLANGSAHVAPLGDLDEPLPPDPEAEIRF